MHLSLEHDDSETVTLYEVQNMRRQARPIALRPLKTILWEPGVYSEAEYRVAVDYSVSSLLRVWARYVAVKLNYVDSKELLFRVIWDRKRSLEALV